MSQQEGSAREGGEGQQRKLGEGDMVSALKVVHDGHDLDQAYRDSSWGTWR